MSEDSKEQFDKISINEQHLADDNELMLMYHNRDMIKVQQAHNQRISICCFVLWIINFIIPGGMFIPSRDPLFIVIGAILVVFGLGLLMYAIYWCNTRYDSNIDVHTGYSYYYYDLNDQTIKFKIKDKETNNQVHISEYRFTTNFGYIDDVVEFKYDIYIWYIHIYYIQYI